MHARATLLLAAVLVATTIHARAAAQDACHVAVGDLTVNDEPPPEQYREMLANGIRPTIDPILQCYRDRVAQRPGLQGNLQLRLWVSARQVIRVTPETNTLQDPELEQCAIARIREFRLPPEAPEGGARVRFVLRFTLTGAGAAPATTAPATTEPASSGTTSGASGTTTAGTSGSAGAATSGTRPPLVIQIPPSVQQALPAGMQQALGSIIAPAPRASVAVGAIRGAIGADVLAQSIPGAQFDACPAGAGTVETRLSIAADGRVRARAARGSTLSRETQRCVVDALQALRMPAAAGNTRATITITLAR